MTRTTKIKWTERQKLDWFEKTYCQQCPRYEFPTGEVCPRCPNTQGADDALSEAMRAGRLLDGVEHNGMPDMRRAEISDKCTGEE